MKTIIAEIGFKPVSVTLVFETQKELDAFGSLCNCVPILSAISSLNGRLPDANALTKIGANIHNTDEIVEGLKESHYFRHLLKKN